VDDGCGGRYKHGVSTLNECGAEQAGASSTITYRQHGLSQGAGAAFTGVNGGDQHSASASVNGYPSRGISGDGLDRLDLHMAPSSSAAASTGAGSCIDPVFGVNDLLLPSPSHHMGPSFEALLTPTYHQQQQQHQQFWLADLDGGFWST